MTKNRLEGSKPTIKTHFNDFMGEGNLDQFTKTMEQVKLYVGWAYGDRFCHSG